MRGCCFVAVPHQQSAAAAQPAGERTGSDSIARAPHDTSAAVGHDAYSIGQPVAAATLSSDHLASPGMRLLVSNISLSAP
jgi:hypothetical protein